MEGAMVNRRRMIRIDGKSLQLTPDFIHPLSSTNLPSSLVFRGQTPIYWETEIKGFDRATGILQLKVIDYYPIQFDSFDQQSMKSSVQFVDFDKLDWKYLEPFLAAYNKADLGDLIIDSQTTFTPDVSIAEIPLKVKVGIKDLHFSQGYVSFRHYLDRLNEEIEIRVPNIHIVPEFKLIRSFFVRQLKRKTIIVEGKVYLRGTQIQNIEARSREIARINDNMIGTFRLSQLKELRKKDFITSIDKSLFTADEAFDTLDDDVGNVLELRVQDIIRTLADHGLVRNRKQLEYLSGRKQVADQKVHLTLTPVFGFVFLVEGEVMHHFCWELIDSHATYLWSFDKVGLSIPEAWKKLEQIIGLIRHQGRESYKRSFVYRDEGDFLFQTVVHRHADSNSIDPFPLWRQRFEEKLV